MCKPRWKRTDDNVWYRKNYMIALIGDKWVIFSPYEYEGFKFSNLDTAIYVAERLMKKEV